MAESSDPTLLPASFEAHPSTYKHLRLEVEGAVARLLLDVQEDQGLRPGYALKLNSYDLSVDLELADAIQRLRFEHPEVGCVVLTSAQDAAFCAGANIFMLGSSTHAFKVNFCKFTNETRLYIEDASQYSGQRYLAALNGVASGGGYELPLACDEIMLVDDRKSAVALPEVPYLGVLPGTGGITRVTDKRKVRRDRADVFISLAEGIKGKRAVEWGLVDAVVPSSRFAAACAERAQVLAAGGHPERRGVPLESVQPTVDGGTAGGAFTYRHVHLSIDGRSARLRLTVPDDAAFIPEDPTEAGSDLYLLRAFRELDDALLRLRFHFPEVGLVLLETRGDAAVVRAMDASYAARRSHWFVAEVLGQVRRTLKRLDVTSKSFYAVVDQGSCFVGTLAELLLASDRAYMLAEDGVTVGLTDANGGLFPMGNGLSRLSSRFLADPAHAAALGQRRDALDGEEAAEQGLVTFAFDELDWDDELRLAVEERISLSPDALSGMESNVRFAGPETLETKIFGRLSAWQNWIFQRPNAVGERGALTLYGQPVQAQFDFRRC